MVCLNNDQELFIKLNMDGGGQLAALIKGATYKDGSNVFPESSKNAANQRVQTNKVVKARGNWKKPTFPDNLYDRLEPTEFI